MMGRYLDGSMLTSLPGLVTGIILAIFHLFGKHHLFKLSLQKEVTTLGMPLKTCIKISLVIPPGPGAFLRLKHSMICLTSSCVKLFLRQ